MKFNLYFLHFHWIWINLVQYISIKIYSFVVGFVKSGGAVKTMLYIVFLTVGCVYWFLWWFCWVEGSESILLYILLINLVCSVCWSPIGSFRDVLHCTREWLQIYIHSLLSISVWCEEFNKRCISYLLPMPLKSNSKAKIIYVHWETDYPWCSVIYIFILMLQPLLFNVRCHSWKVLWQKSAVNGPS
jgi:hypothetical protein